MLRPLVLTHPGDGSGRLCVATQHGVIYSFANDQSVTESKVFLDLQSKVRYHDQTNEEGFLGLAFHPKFKSNGEFFVFYTDKKAKLTNVVSRFRCRKDDPNQADPTSEEEILRIQNTVLESRRRHIVFGPDGYLYIALGDGGAANDPHNNGQNLERLLGKVLRIDVDRQDDGKSLRDSEGQPVRQPRRTLGRRSGPTVCATSGGWRSTARPASSGPAMSARICTRKSTSSEQAATTAGTCAKACIPSAKNGVGRRPESHRTDLGIPPRHRQIDHRRRVYRGKRLPELRGAYLYGDYVSKKIWALWYDEKRAASSPIGQSRIQKFHLLLRRG